MDRDEPSEDGGGLPEGNRVSTTGARMSVFRKLPATFTGRTDFVAGELRFVSFVVTPGDDAAMNWSAAWSAVREARKALRINWKVSECVHRPIGCL